MQIFVKTLTDKTITLWCRPSDRIRSLVDRMKLRSGLTTSRLSFFGKPLREDRTLSDYNIQKESTLTVLGGLMGGRGGKKGPTPQFKLVVMAAQPGVALGHTPAAVAADLQQVHGLRVVASAYAEGGVAGVLVTVEGVPALQTLQNVFHVSHFPVDQESVRIRNG